MFAMNAKSTLALTPRIYLIRKNIVRFFNEFTVNSILNENRISFRENGLEI